MPPYLRRLVFVRPGATEEDGLLPGRRDPPLSEEGRRRVCRSAHWVEPTDLGPDVEGVKLHKLYVRADARRCGAARALLAVLEREARKAGARSLVLQVNRRNHEAIAAHEALGFARRREGVVDIGGGFVMDDYWMAKSL